MHIQTLIIRCIPLRLIEWYESWALKKDRRILNLITHLNREVTESIVKRKLIRIFKLAAKSVPAYKDFLKSRKVNIDVIDSLNSFNSLVPATTKDNYVNDYPIEKRCLYGKLPKHGNVDESAGSTGTPTNWVRSTSEEAVLRKLIRFEFDYDLDGDKKDYIVLNTWSSGPWATGVKFSEIMQEYSLIKNIGPDVSNTLRTLKFFGNKYNYIIAGYPPFIKELIDLGQKRIKWKNYRINIITGGEEFIPEWRDYINKKLGQCCQIFSAYGSSDIDIGIAFETLFTKFIRSLIRKNIEIRKTLFGDKIPMVFQYDPLRHYIRNVTNRRKDGSYVSEFEVTELDESIVSPKIKYNIHDEGGVFEFQYIIDILSKYDNSFIEEFKEVYQTKPILKLPILWIVGRTDGTISIDGANIYPSQIEMCLHCNKELSHKTNLFKISVLKSKRGGFRFAISVELKDGYKPSLALQKKYHDIILSNLQKFNNDYRESYVKNKACSDPKIIIYKYDTGPFRSDRNLVKNKYIL